MELVMLGTGHGDPSARRCNSAMLLRCGAGLYLLDAGDGACTRMIRMGFSPSELSGTFISHMHDDHVGGILSIVKSALKYRMKYPAKQLKIYLPQKNAVQALRQWLGIFFTEEELGKIVLESYRSGTFFQDGNIRLTAHPTAHLPPDESGSPRSFAWTIEGGGRKIMVTGDLSRDFHDFPLSVLRTEKFDAVICELTHFDLASALPVLTEFQCGRLIFTHVYDFWDSPEGMAEFQKLSARLPYPAVTAEDGTTFTI